MAGSGALHVKRALTPQGWRDDVRLQWRDGLFASVEIGVAPQPDDERADLAAPGVGNLHSHAFQRAMSGFAERRGPGADSFWSWRETMYRFALAISPDDAEAIAAMAYVEMLEAGYTRVGEFHYLHHAPDGAAYADRAEMSARIAAAAAQTGLGLTLLPVFYAHSGFGGAAPTPGQRRFINDLDGFARLLDGSAKAVGALPGGRLGVAPHSLRAVTPEELRHVAGLRPGAPVHIHAAEQVAEVEGCFAWSGARPVRFLLDHADVDARWCVIHATHMDADETEGLARSGAVAGLCPITEANLGDGVFNAPDFAAAGGAYGVGTDSNVEITLAGELRLLEYSQRLARRARNVAAAPGASTGRALLEAATAGGARALGGPPAGFRPGAEADIVTLKPDPLAQASGDPDAPLDRWIFSGGGLGTERVYARGHCRVRDGAHVARQAIAKRFEAAMLKLLAGPARNQA